MIWLTGIDLHVSDCLNQFGWCMLLRYIEEHVQRTGVAIETQGFTLVTSGRKRESLMVSSWFLGLISFIVLFVIVYFFYFLTFAEYTPVEPDSGNGLILTHCELKCAKCDETDSLYYVSFLLNIEDSLNLV